MAVCPGTNHTAAFFGMSLEPAGGGIWQEVDRIRDTFRCRHFGPCPQSVRHCVVERAVSSVG